jgi:hypothetical protein
VVKSGCDRRLDEAAAALRSGGRQVRLVALSQSGEWERERMGGPARRVEEEEGGPGSRQGARCQAGARGGVRTGKNRGGREAADRWGPGTVLAIQIKSNRSKTIQMNSNLNQIRSNFILPKHDLHKLKKIEIKYCFERFDERNNFLHSNLSRFKMDFKIKFRESKV